MNVVEATALALTEEIRQRVKGWTVHPLIVSDIRGDVLATPTIPKHISPMQFWEDSIPHTNNRSGVLVKTPKHLNRIILINELRSEYRCFVFVARGWQGPRSAHRKRIWSRCNGPPHNGPIIGQNTLKKQDGYTKYRMQQIIWMSPAISKRKKSKQIMCEIDPRNQQTIEAAAPHLVELITKSFPLERKISPNAYAIMIRSES